MIVAGASAYPRIIDFERIGRDRPRRRRAAVRRHGAHRRSRRGGPASRAPSRTRIWSRPRPTRRCAARAAAWSSAREALGKQVDKTVFPGIQGGPLMHVIAAKAVALKLAADRRVPRRPARGPSRTPRCSPRRWRSTARRVVSGGTDNHLMLVDVTPLGVTGKEAEALLDEVGITVNKNAIPFDPLPPNIAVGHPRRHAGDDDARLRAATRCAEVGRTDRASAITHRDDARRTAAWRDEVTTICARFPVPGLPAVVSPERALAGLPSSFAGAARRRPRELPADTARHPASPSAWAQSTTRHDERRVHQHPIPRTGGLAVAASFVVVGVIGAGAERASHFAGCRATSCGIRRSSRCSWAPACGAFLGYLDDRLQSGLAGSWSVQLVLAGIAISPASRSTSIVNPFGSSPIRRRWLVTTSAVQPGRSA